MSFKFESPWLFRSSKTDEKISFKIPTSMIRALDELSEFLEMDRSKTIRWCLEQVLREAIEHGKINPPEHAKKTG